MAQAYQLAWLIAEGRAHWKKHLPILYARLKNSGTLESALKSAAERTQTAMQQLEKTGMTPAEAWPETRADHLILDPKDFNKESAP